MDNLLDRVIGQFDTLIPFLAISHEEVFNLINREGNIWFSNDQKSSFPSSYRIYQTQITHPAFLLGYSYFEAFLADLIRQIYVSRPTMLPKEKQLKYSEILNAANYNNIIEMMIQRVIVDLFYKRMDEIIEYFEEKLSLEWLDDFRTETVVISHLRNCIIHNLSRADLRLSQISEYNAGDKIELSTSDVHTFGLKARDLVRHLYNQAIEKHFDHSND